MTFFKESLRRLSHESTEMPYLLKQDEPLRLSYPQSADKIFVVKAGISIKTHFLNRRVAL